MTPAQIAAQLARLSDDDLRKAIRTLPRQAIEQLIDELRMLEPASACRLIGLLSGDHLGEIFVKHHEVFMEKVRPVAEEITRLAFARCEGWEPAMVAIAVAKMAMVDALKDDVPKDVALGIIDRVNTILSHCSVHTFEKPEELHTRLNPKTKAEA